MKASMVGGIAIAAILWTLPAQAYHCRPGKIWLRHDRVCVPIQHQATRHARVWQHHAHHHVSQYHPKGERLIEPPPMKRGDRLVTEPRPAPAETPVFTLPFDIPPTTTIRQPPQWRL